jgi:subfamily B ATP-binding cassette protein MsbA
LQNLSDDASGGFQTGVAWIDQHVLGVGKPTLERIYRICGVILLSMWLRLGFGYLSDLCALHSRIRSSAELRRRIVAQLQSVALRFYTKTRSGELVNTLTNELGRVTQSFQVVNTLIIQGALLIIYVGFMFLVSWQLSLITLGFFIVLTLTLTRVINKIRRGSKKISKASGRYTSSIAELINGIRTVVAFNTQEFERKRLDGTIDRLADTMIATERQRLQMQPVSQAVVGTLLITIIILATRYYVLPGKLDMALLLAFLFALIRLMPILHELNKLRGSWASLRGSLDNTVRLLRRDDKPYMSSGTRKLEHFKEAIVFENVDFAYEPGQPILKNIDIRVQCGKTTALVGSSGAGKSTLVDLIPRFHDATAGRVLLDGVDIRDFDLYSLRDKIAIVSQDTFIFNDTVEANIAYGLPDTTMEQVMDAADKANALEFIDEMADGMQTVLGDRGVRLSGGQRQRLAIARALLRDPEILILDEATSALDSVSERLVQQSLERLMEGRTVVAIAHRLSTVENADWVVVLEDGIVVEEGTYEELLERRGQLWEYHALQFQLS